jgi:hypothetical protein
VVPAQHLAAVRKLSSDWVAAGPDDNASVPTGGSRLIPRGEKHGETVWTQQGIVVEPQIEVGIFLGSVLPSQAHPVAPEKRTVAFQDRDCGVRCSHRLCRSIRAAIIYQVNTQSIVLWQRLPK